MTRALIAAALLVAAPSLALADTFGPLVTPTDLAQEMDSVQPIVVDIRDDGYDKSHLPTAYWAPYRLFRGPDDNPGGMVDVATLEETYETLGLEYDLPIVLVTDGKTDTDFGAAARVYWTLKSSGFTDLTILNGGQAAWEAAGLPVETIENTNMPSELDITFSDQWLAETPEIERIVDEGDADVVLLDARPTPFFSGREAHGSASRPGTLPGAQNVSYEGFFDGSPRISSDIDVAGLKQTLGIADGTDKEIVAFCNTGHWAATSWFALSELGGIEDVKLYPGSMVEYSQTGRPMENQPGLVDNLLRQVFGK